MPCSKGRKGAGGKYCPYIENEPGTDEARAIWTLVGHSSGQLRLGGMGGVCGFDMTAIFAMADAMNIDRGIVAELMPSVEAGMVAALNKSEED